MSVINERMEFRRKKKQPIFNFLASILIFPNIKTKGTHSFDVRTRILLFVKGIVMASN